MPPKAVKGEYIETDTGNKVSRKAFIHGTQNIILGGKSAIQAECTLRGDLKRSVGAQDGSPTQVSKNSKAPSTPAVSMGRYCILSRGSLLKPPSKPYRVASSTSTSSSTSGNSLAVPGSDQTVAKERSHSYHPLHLSSHIHVGQGTVCEAASIGSHVDIGTGCVIGKFAIIKDHVIVLDGAVVPSGMVIPSFSVVAGRPARVVGEVPEGGVGNNGDTTREEYKGIR